MLGNQPERKMIMEGGGNYVVLKHAVFRALVVSAACIVLGVIIFQNTVFIPTMRAFQFTLSGITAGISYAALKASSIRNGVVSLCVWYLVLTFLIEQYNSWLLVLNLVYLAGIAVAVYFYLYVMNVGLVRGAVQRIAAMAVITAITNGLIVIVLGAFALGAVVNRPAAWLESALFNLEIGTLIGLAVGVGIEITEYLAGRWSEVLKRG